MHISISNVTQHRLPFNTRRTENLTHRTHVTSGYFHHGLLARNKSKDYFYVFFAVTVRVPVTSDDFVADMLEKITQILQIIELQLLLGS